MQLKKTNLDNLVFPKDFAALLVRLEQRQLDLIAGFISGSGHDGEEWQLKADFSGLSRRAEVAVAESDTETS